MKEKKEIIAALEALLFVYGEPMKSARICKALEISSKELAETVSELSARLKECSSGLRILEKEDAIQLVSAPEQSGLLAKLVKAELSEGLSPAALETLAIVAYCGPISRSHLDYVRGVNSSFTLRNLLLRGLIERKADEKRKGSFQYRMSFELLRHLGLEKKEDLPEYEKFRTAVQELFVEEGGNLENKGLIQES